MLPRFARQKPPTLTVHFEYHLIRSAMRNKNTQLPHNTQEGDEGIPDQAAPLHFLYTHCLMCVLL